MPGTDTPPPADADDARQTLNRARQRYEQICDELRDIRIERRDRAAARDTTS
ncbi:hypothetical protein [Kitasatospora sp. NPDC127116]|uniref:hypothetical protein n=1 Tax=Kitasatospora sp. NPDC127116 TaxID=3345367 RepID=UPI00363E183B